jgi:hypothetical protein
MSFSEKESNLLRIMKSKKSWTDPGGSVDLYSLAYNTKKMKIKKVFGDLKINNKLYSKNFVKNPSFEDLNSKSWYKYCIIFLNYR